MAERLVNVGRSAPVLLPVGPRGWVPVDDLVLFVISALETAELPSLSVNERGTGSRQYPPAMMLALLIYCYANGVFSSRRIERLTYRDVAVRYLTGDTHPDHDTICTFRRENASAVREAFVEVLKIARAMGLVTVGTVSVDGTHIKANASKQKSVSYDRAGELEAKLRNDIEELLERAEQSDSDGSEDPQALPQQIARRERLREKMAEARRELERRAADRDSDDDDSGSAGASQTSETPHVEATKQINLTDADSCLMRKSNRESWKQAYNDQAVVDADGSQLVLGSYVVSTPSDAHQLEAAVGSISGSIGSVQRVLADGGYVNSRAFKRLEGSVDLYVAMANGEYNERRYDFRPTKPKKPKHITDPRLVAIREKLSHEENRRIYQQRAKTVEPVFGTIKGALQYRQFLLRGLSKVHIEWNLVCLAYNVKRLWKLAKG